MKKGKGKWQRWRMSLFLLSEEKNSLSKFLFIKYVHISQYLEIYHMATTT
jgi:hypothetical protein